MNNYNYYDYPSNSCVSCVNFLATFLLIIFLLVWLCISIIFARYVGKKAENAGHSFGLWAFLGFIFGLFALLALHIAITAEDSKEIFTLWAILGFLLGFTALIMLQTGLIAKRKNYDFTSYCLIGFIGGLLALLIVCFLPQNNEDKKIQLQDNEKSNSTSSKFLESCNNKKWTCPKCGELNVFNATHCINCYTKKPE